MWWFRRKHGETPVTGNGRAAQRALDEAKERLATARDRTETVDEFAALMRRALGGLK